MLNHISPPEKRCIEMIKSWFAKYFGKKNQDTAFTPPLSQDTNDFYENYFTLIASGARLKLVEAMFRLNLFALFENNPCVLEQEIIEKLGLMPNRAKKWLHLLSCEGFLTKITLENQAAYQLPEQFIKLRNSERWWPMEFFFNSWNVAADENLADVLRYGKVKTSVSWPPKTETETVWLEDWMMKTAKQPIDIILESINFKKVTSLLDVGGGDGTMACAFATAHPHIKAAVYNLPQPAEMAKKMIASQGLSHQVKVFAGDFIKDTSFPTGFDLILFTRVLFDWDEAVDRKLLTMAYNALPENGLVSICEFYKEENNDRCLAAEYRYLFHDDFTPHVMKSGADYRRMLEDIGFTIVNPNTEKKPDFVYCSVILARKSGRHT